jgi:hypothetical protein
MAMYVRHTRSVQLDELPAHIRSKLADHAESRQIQLNGVRAWLTPIEKRRPVRDSGSCCAAARNQPIPMTSTARYWCCIRLKSWSSSMVPSGGRLRCG